jgi:hypothetical protein
MYQSSDLIHLRRTFDLSLQPKSLLRFEFFQVPLQVVLWFHLVGPTALLIVFQLRGSVQMPTGDLNVSAELL